jgi:fibronectin-binding autotransporter adhesin
MNFTGNRLGRRNSLLVEDVRGRRKWILLAAASATAGTLLTARTSRAGTDAWSTTPVNGNFSGVNWTTGTTVPGAPTGTAATNDSLYFGTSSITALTNDDTGFSFGGFTFNSGASAFTIGGNSISLSGAVTNNSTNLQTLNLSQTLSANGVYDPAFGAIAIGGNISGNYSLIKYGGAALTLSGINTYTGSTTVGLNPNGTNVTPQIYQGGGTLNLNFAAASAPTVNLLYNGIASGNLQISGGNVNMIGATGAANVQAFNQLIISDGLSNVNVTGGAGGTAAINFGTIGVGGNGINNRAGQLNFAFGAGGSATTTGLNGPNGGLLASSANLTPFTVNQTDWATSAATQLTNQTYSSTGSSFSGALSTGSTVTITANAPTGLNAGALYYVVNGSGSTYQLSSTLGGSPISFTTSGSNATVNVGGAITALPSSSYVSNTTSSLGSTAQNTNFVTDSTIGSSTTNTLRFNTADTTGLTNTLTINSGNTLTLYGGGLMMTNNVGANAVTIQGGTLIGNSNRALLLFNYNTTPGSSLNIASSIGVNISSGGGDNDVIIGGAGTTIFSGANTYNGQTELSGGGTLSVSSDSNLGGGAGSISVTSASTSSASVTATDTVNSAYNLIAGTSLLGSTIKTITNSGSTLTITLNGNANATIGSASNASYATGSALSLSGNSTFVANGTFALQETNTAAGSATNNRNIGLGAVGGQIDVTGTNTLTIPGVINSLSNSGYGALTKRDTGSLLLSGANAYYGGTAIDGGTIIAGSTSALGAATGTLTFGASSNATLNTNGNALTVANLTGDSTATITGLGNLTDNVAAGTTSEYDGVITSSAARVLTVGGGTLTLGGTATNTNDNLTISSGTVILNKSSSGSGVSAVLDATVAGTLIYGANTVGNSGIGTGQVDGSLIMNGGTVDLNGNSGYDTSVLAIKNGTNGASSVITNNNLNAGTITVNAAFGGTNTFSGTLKDGLGTLSLVVEGASTSPGLTLNGTSTYSGATTINSGTLTVDASTNAGASIAGSKAIAVAAAGTLHLITVVGGTGSGGSSVSLLNTSANVTVAMTTNAPFDLELNGNTQQIASFTIGMTSEPAGYYGSYAFFNSYGTGLSPADPTTEGYFSGDGGFDVVPTPEPTMAGLLGLGGGTALLRRRRKQA